MEEVLCIFCHTTVKKFQLHLQRHHLEEPRVKECFEAPSVKRRTMLLSKLQKEGCQATANSTSRVRVTRKVILPKTSYLPNSNLYSQECKNLWASTIFFLLYLEDNFFCWGQQRAERLKRISKVYNKLICQNSMVMVVTHSKTIHELLFLFFILCQEMGA